MRTYIKYIDFSDTDAEFIVNKINKRIDSDFVWQKIEQYITDKEEQQENDFSFNECINVLCNIENILNIDLNTMTTRSFHACREYNSPYNNENHP